MADELEALFGLFEDHLWGGVFPPDRAVVPDDLAELTARLVVFLNERVGDPVVAPVCPRTRRGPGRFNARVVKPIAAAWRPRLAAALDRSVQGGKAVCATLPATGRASPRRVFILVQGARHAVDLGREISAITSHATALRDQVERLEAVARRLAPGERADTGSPGGSGTDPAADDRLLLKRAYDGLNEAGWGYVPIHRLRAALDWARDRFDGTIRALHLEGRVELQVGNPSDYTAREVDGSYTESDGTLYLTLSWRASR